MESNQKKRGLGSLPIIEPFLERNGETFGARVTRFLPTEPCVLPAQSVKMYRGYKTLAQMLVEIGLELEEELGIHIPPPALDDTSELH